MKWYQGSIAEAITASKAKKAIFVVFIEGNDDTSKEVSQTIESTEVSSRLETDKFVAIKLHSETENYKFFAQIYQLVPVPSIFFIGDNGTPLEIIGSPLPPSDMSVKIDSILQKTNPQTKHSSANLIEAEQKAHSSNTTQDNVKLEKPEVNPSTSSQTSSQTLQDFTKSDATNSSAVPTSEPRTTPQLSQEEKIRRARELIEIQNKKKAEENERKEREREIERRKMGKDVQKLRQEQKDREIREAHEERMKEKAARAKVLQQIAEDKLERKKRNEINNLNTNQDKSAAQQKTVQENLQAANDLSKARIQFKLPTGNTILGTFEATSKFNSLRTYVIQNAQLPFRHFSMSSFFPRRDFTNADDNKTLLELELVPSSVILILPVKSSNTTTVIKSADGAGFFSHFFWTLLTPVVSIYNYVMGFFNGRPRGSESGNANVNVNSGSSLGGNIESRFANIGTRRLGGLQTSKIRSRGNIHTLHSGDNDNDENNTWNGNSTQQM